MQHWGSSLQPKKEQLCFNFSWSLVREIIWGVKICFCVFVNHYTGMYTFRMFSKLKFLAVFVFGRLHMTDVWGNKKHITVWELWRLCRITVLNVLSLCLMFFRCAYIRNNDLISNFTSSKDENIIVLLTIFNSFKIRKDNVIWEAFGMNVTASLRSGYGKFIPVC